MTNFMRAALAATTLALVAAPAAGAMPGPPLDPVKVSGPGSCGPPEDPNPCDPTPGEVTVDKTYPSRLVAWAEDVLP